MSVPSSGDIAQCRHILNGFRRWYEKQVLGCSLERWQAVQTWDDLQAWLDEDALHQNSELGFFLKIGQSTGMDRLGRGPDCFISAGGPDVPGSDGSTTSLVPAGVFSAQGIAALDPEKITEDVTCSFFKETPGHPFESRTLADPDTTDARKYSWSKAPRYDGKPARNRAAGRSVDG